MKRLSMAATVALALPVSASAQTARPMLEYATAAKMRDACLTWAGQRKLQVVVAVYDDAGKLMTLAHMDGARTGSNQLAQEKGLSAARFRMSTEKMGKLPLGYVPGLIVSRGGQPFTGPDGVALGSIGVSGATSQEDADCGRAAIIAAGLTPEEQ